MANTTIYPFGTGGSLPSSIGIINDLVNGGADKALSAEQGKILGEDVADLQGAINSIAFVNRETTTLSKADILGLEYLADKIARASDAVENGNISAVYFGNSVGGGVYKIPVSAPGIITFPVFKTSQGYGNIFTRDNGDVISAYYNDTIETGGTFSMIIPEGASFLYLSISASLSSFDYSVLLEGTGAVLRLPDKVLSATIRFLPMLSTLTSESDDSLCLAAIKTRIVNDAIPFHCGFLFHKLPGDDGKIFYGTKLNNAVEIGTLDYTPKDYVLAVSPKDGTIIAAARDQRLPLRVYHNGQNYIVNAKSASDKSPEGWLYNSGVEFIKDGDTEYCVFAEYHGSSQENEVKYIWRGTYPYTSPTDWEAVYYKDTSAYNGGHPTIGSVTHFHMVRRDPWTDILYATTGDYTGQFFWLYSTDYGENWTELATDHIPATTPSWVLDGQPLRCINFLFTEDYIYFATDHGSNNTLSRIKRDSGTGVIDLDTREILYDMPYGIATNSICLVESPHGIFMFTRIDTGFSSEYDKPVPVLFWSLDDERMYTIARIPQLVESWGGHRGKCYSNYTNGQESHPAMGFADNTPCQFAIVGADGTNIGTIFYDI